MPTTRHSLDSSRSNKDAVSSSQQKEALTTAQKCTRNSAGLRKGQSENVMSAQKGNDKSSVKSRHSQLAETAKTEPMDDNSEKMSMMTRRSKRTAESPKAVPDKKPKLEQIVKKEIESESIETPKQTPTPKVKVERGKSRYSETGVNVVPPSVTENVGENAEKSKIIKISTEQELKNTDKNSTKVIKARSLNNETIASPKSRTNYVQSPRRSSRTVIPNTRYKDMVDPLKKTAVVKTEVLSPDKDTSPQKMISPDIISIPADLQEEPTDVIEEIVTEETRIDTFAQMNLAIEHTQSTSTNDEEPSSFDNLSEESSSGIKIIQIQNDSSADAASVVKQEGGGDNTEVGTVTVKDGQRVQTFGALPEPQVIVIPNESGKTASKIIIPKDPYRARLEQAFENKGSSMIFGPSTGKFKTRKLIVTPTHTHTSKKEAQKAKMARQVEAATSDSNKTSTSVIYPWMQQSGVGTGQIIHTPEKRSVEVISQHQANVPTTAVVSQTMSVPSENVNLQCNEEILDFGSVDTGSNKTRVSQTIQHVKIVYVKAKPGPDGTNRVTVDTVSASDVEHNGEPEEVTNVTVPSTRIEAVANPVEKNVKSELTIYGEDDSADKLVAISESSDIETNQPEHTDESVNGNTVEKSISDAELPLEQKIANTLCHVVEYKEQRPHYQPSSAIEYVLLDNKMIPIHKPFTIGPHGRIHSGRQTFAEQVVPGRMKGRIQKTPISVSDEDLLTAVRATVAQTEGGTIQSFSESRALHGGDNVSAAEESQMSVTAVDENGKTIQIEQPLVTHGYIDRPVISSSPPQIVEISTEAFTKEVYGDSFTLDPVSGELLTGSIVVADGNQVIQSESAVTGSLNQSEVSTIEDQSEIQQNVEKIDDQNGEIKESVDWSENTATEMADKEISSTLIPIQNDGNIFLESMNYYNDSEASTENLEKTDENKSGSVVVHVETTQGEGKVPPHGTGKVPRVVKVNIHSKQPHEAMKELPTDVKDSPVQKLPYVNITPVRAYTKKNEDENPKQMVTKATGTDAFDDEDEQSMPVKGGKANKGQQFEEYIVVHLPEGTEIKQFRTRSRQETSTGEAVTLDSDGMYICVDCGHKTDRSGNWMKHRRKHLGIRPHACPKCSYKAATSSNLKRHLQIHDDIRNFQCHYCNLLFRQKIHLERHLKYKHEEKNVKCPLCDYVCSSENPDLKIHIRRRHMPHEGALNAFTCDICGLMTVSKKDLKQHMKFHKNGPELKLFCEHCSFVTDCVSRLRRHMLIHTKERPFQCGMCPYRASQKEHVLRHMRSQHGVEVERNQRRSLLSKNEEQDSEVMLVAGSSPSALSGDDAGNEPEFGPFEKSDFSSTDKIFACNYCSMKFAKLINLYKHLYAQHKQIMPEEGPNDYQCVVCDFRTNNKKNLLVHMRKHNMQDHSPPTHVYSCVLCRYMNPRRRNLFQHMKKKHGIEIIMKDDGLNCYVTLDSNAAQVQGQDVGKTNVIALSDIVTTQTMDDVTELEFIGESSDDAATLHAEKISIDNIDNIIPIEEMGSYVVSDSSQEHDTGVHQVSISSSLHATVQEHEAAEAIEGLQALAEQAGILETQNIDNDMTAEIVAPAIEIAATEIMNDGEITTGSEILESTQTTGVEQTAEGTEDIQLSSEQLNQLSSGDYVEINGEVYKVEIAPALQQAQ